MMRMPTGPGCSNSRRSRRRWHQENSRKRQTERDDRRSRPHDGRMRKMVDIRAGAGEVIHPAEVEDVELYHPHSWWTKYVFSQDAKVIAVQYAITAMAIGMVALVLSWLMR